MQEEVRKKLTAYHEAGHALIANSLDVPIEYVTIGIKPNYAGETSYKDINCDKDLIYMKKRIIIAFAGGFASIKYDPSRITSIGDYDFACKLATKIIGDKKKKEYLKIAEAKAKEAVNKNKSSIAKVAKKLLIKNKLTGEELMNLL